MEKLLINIDELGNIESTIRNANINIESSYNYFSSQSMPNVDSNYFLNQSINSFLETLTNELSELRESITVFADYVTFAKQNFAEIASVLSELDFSGSNIFVYEKTQDYTVKPGDSLWAIAFANGLTIAELKANNKLTSDVIHPGDKLIINPEKMTLENIEQNQTNQSTSQQIDSGTTTKQVETNQKTIPTTDSTSEPEPIPETDSTPTSEQTTKPKEKTSGNGGELKYDEPYNVTKNHLTRSAGVAYYNGHKETWYSQEVLPGGGLTALNNNGRHVASDGTIRDGDGYIAVAADLSIYQMGTVVMTSLGPAKVYDTGVSGQHIDIYVSTRNGW